MRARILLVTTAMLATLAMSCSAPHPSMTAPGPPDAQSVVLPPPDGGPVTWDGWAGAFVQDYCVQCHNPASPCSNGTCHALPDFRQQATVAGLAPAIRCGVATAQDPAWDCGSVAPEQFPVSGGGNAMPTDEQRAALVAWIDAGCP